MKLEHYSQNKLKKDVHRIVGKYLDLKKYHPFFFGSRVRGDSRERSDIDIGIEGPRKIPPKIFLTLEEEFDHLPMLYKIQLVDFATVSKKFKNEASQYKEYVSKNL